jgi:hypothetical protein
LWPVDLSSSEADEAGRFRRYSVDMDSQGLFRMATKDLLAVKLPKESDGRGPIVRARGINKSGSCPAKRDSTLRRTRGCALKDQVEA